MKTNVKTKELLNLDVKELKAKAKELREEIFWLGFKNKSGQLEKPANIGITKRHLARVLTVLNQKSLSAGE